MQNKKTYSYCYLLLIFKTKKELENLNKVIRCSHGSQYYVFIVFKKLLLFSSIFYIFYILVPFGILSQFFSFLFFFPQIFSFSDQSFYSFFHFDIQMQPKKSSSKILKVKVQKENENEKLFNHLKIVFWKEGNYCPWKLHFVLIEWLTILKFIDISNW